jgi:hypothetical protein
MKFCKLFFKKLVKLVEFVVEKQKIPNFLIKDKICEGKNTVNHPLMKYTKDVYQQVCVCCT